MKTLFLFIFSIVLHPAFSHLPQPYAENQLILKFKPEQNIDAEASIRYQRFGIDKVDALNQKHHLSQIVRTGNPHRTDTYLLTFESPQNIPQLAEQYRKTGLFTYVEPNFRGKGAGQKALLPIIPDDAYFERQWGLYNDGTFSLATPVVDADIDMELAWEIEQGSPDITVAILDSGIKLDHPEFNGRIWQNANETINGLDDDNNGYVDDLNGWNFAYDNNDPTDDYGHGTNVAGIVGASGNNQIGYAGVDWHCKLMSCKILDENNYGYYSWWAEALYYAVDNGADVINMSIGGESYSGLLQEAIDYAHEHNVIMAASMMNENNDLTFYPAGFANTIAVGATDPDDERSAPFFWSASSGSNYGNHIDVVAPGNYIFGLSYQSNANYNTYWGGTSQATPLVTGLCALLLAQNPNRTADEIREIIRYTAEDQVGNPLEDTPGFDIYHGYGRINAYQALMYLMTQTQNTASAEAKLSIYPNPASSYVYVKIPDQASTVSITTLTGSELFRRENLPGGQVLEINTESFGKGIYILRLIDRAGTTISLKKLVVN